MRLSPLLLLSLVACPKANMPDPEAKERKEALEELMFEDDFDDIPEAGEEDEEEEERQRSR